MTLSAVDAQAIASTAQDLGVDPRTLGALMELESGLDPNVWGGSGKKYRGLIQFGEGARKEVGLPDRPMSIAEQMPYVAKYFQQRGFIPGKHGPVELYRTVLVGNPHQSGTDSFGTNSDSAAKRMLPGGDLYERFSSKFTGHEQGLSLGGARPEEAIKLNVDGPLGAMATAMVGGSLSRAAERRRPGRAMAASPGFMEELQEVNPGVAAQVAAVAALLPASSRPTTAGSGPSPAATSTGLSGNYVYEEGGIGPGGPQTYGPHFDIKKTDLSHFERNALDPYVMVNGKPLSSGTTVSGGEFGAPRDGGARKHAGWDYAFGGGGKLTLANGAQWVDSRPGDYGDAAVVRVPGLGDFRILHGKLRRA